MRCGIYVAKKYEVEFGSAEHLNWKQDEFISVLETLGCSVCRYDNEDYSAGDFEVSAEEYKKAMDDMKTFIHYPDDYEGDDLRDAIKATGETPEELLRIMQSYYDEADKHDGYLHFASF